MMNGTESRAASALIYISVGLIIGALVVEAGLPFFVIFISVIVLSGIGTIIYTIAIEEDSSDSVD